MGIFWSLIGRPLIAVQDSEKAHARTLKAMALSDWFLPSKILTKILYSRKGAPVEEFGLTFPNPIGVAAGMDKCAEAVRGWESLGFGFMEIGGITEHAQDGNPKPRMFRAGGEKALVNRMGFNNPGSIAITKRLKYLHDKKRWPNMPVIANLGKSKITPLEEAGADYATTLSRLWPYVDMFIINVSSPNTPNLRELQHDEALKGVLNSCMKAQKEAREEYGGKDKAVLVKIAPDLEDHEILAIVNTARKAGCAGIVATNTTTARPNTTDAKSQKIFAETGGMSGQPLKQRSTEVIRFIADATDGEWPIIGVGGVANADDAWEKIINGASLIQLYSAMVFIGPSIAKKINKGLVVKLKEHGLSDIKQAVGLARKSA